METDIISEVNEALKSLATYVPSAAPTDDSYNYIMYLYNIKEVLNLYEKLITAGTSDLEKVILSEKIEVSINEAMR